VITPRERNRLSFVAKASPSDLLYSGTLLQPIAIWTNTVCPSQVPIGYTTEWAENGPSLQFGSPYLGAYVDSPSPPLDDASAADLITGIHVFRAPCVWIKTRLKECRRTTGFQIVRPPRLRPCDGCGHGPDESQGGQ